MEKANNTKFLFIVILFIVVVAGGLFLTKNIGKTSNQVNAENSKAALSKVLKNITVKDVEKIKGTVELGENNLESELPDIEKYPLVVEGKGDINIEIFSSPEKAGKGSDGWLCDVAEEFNNQKNQIDGKTISVSVRSVASGLAVDYIVSGKYVPDAISPSNELWGEMIKSQRVAIEKVEDSLVANQAGIIFSKKAYDEFVNKYGEMSLDKVVEATAKDGLAMGYTNPYASSTGLNFLVSTLSKFDSENLLSDKAVSGFQEFQANVPFVSYTTMQMRDAVSTGSLDAFVLEYQTYCNDADLTRNYVFTPFGVPHNNPMYAVGQLEDSKLQALKKFTEYAKSEKSQKLATDYGFNQNLDYANSDSYDGNTLFSAQKIWKEEKDSGKPIIAVFVTDISGSMAGVPINELRKSLINASGYINSNNYIGLVSYNNDVYKNLEIDKFDINQRAYFNGAVQNLSATGGTATCDALLVALDMVLTKKEEMPEAKTMILLLSDGKQNRGTSLGTATDILENLEVPVYTIGYGEDAEKEALSKIASINEAASITADSDDVVYTLKNLFNSSL